MLARLLTAMLSTTAARSAAPRAAAPKDEARVTTAHSFTGRMCAASRDDESRRADGLFVDPTARGLAGAEGRAAPMGAWILVPRTRHGDDFLVEHYRRGCRQLVLLGAGFDARAYRTFAPAPGAPPPAAAARRAPRNGGGDDAEDADADGDDDAAGAVLRDLAVFEVDQQTTFDVKEPLLAGAPLAVASRAAVATDFSKRARGGGGARWADDLRRAGFDPSVPTVWLLEGLLYYLADSDVADAMREIGALSANGSAVFHDSITASYVAAGIAPGGAPFVSGSDDYARLWREHAGFSRTRVRDFRHARVDRAARCLVWGDDEVGGAPSLAPAECRGRQLVLFVESEKVGGEAGDGCRAGAGAGAE